MDPLHLGIILLAVLPFLSGLAVAYAFNGHESPPVWAIGYLLVVTGCYVGLACFPFLSLPLALTCVVGGIGCAFISLAFSLRRTTSMSFPRAYGISTMILFPFFIWLELRFCMIVLDPDGNLVEAHAITLHHPPDSMWETYDYCRSKQTKNGILYFGFIQWLRHKGRWTFNSYIGDRKNRYIHDLNWERATWDQWPKIVILQPRRVP